MGLGGGLCHGGGSLQYKSFLVKLLTNINHHSMIKKRDVQLTPASHRVHLDQLAGCSKTPESWHEGSPLNASSTSL